MVDDADVAQSVAFDPATLALILAILAAVLPKLLACMNPKAEEAIRRPTWLQRRRLLWIVRRKVPSNVADFRLVRDEVYAALLRTGRRLDKREVVALLEG